MTEQQLISFGRAALVIVGVPPGLKIARANFAIAFFLIALSAFAFLLPVLR